MEAWLCGPDEALIPAAVTDLKNGTYSVEFCVARAGAWTLKAQVRHLLRYIILCTVHDNDTFLLHAFPAKKQARAMTHRFM